jgi:hypothetical protein
MPPVRQPFAQQHQQTEIPNQKMGFANEREVTATRGVKLRNKGAEQKEQEAKERAEYMRKFDVNADKTMEYHNEVNNRTVEAVKRFLKITEDKTLARNRGVIANDVEREIRQELMELAIDLNNDENEPDNGKGSVVTLTVVLKVLLNYRDRLNDLEYENVQLRRELNKVSSSQT